MLSAEIDDRYIVRIPLIKSDAYTDIRNMLKYFDLKVVSKNVNIASSSLLKFEEVYLHTNTVKAKLISQNHKATAFHPIFSSLFKFKFKNHSITPEFYPLSTVKMDVAKELAKRNVNKLVLYYFLCDNVDFGEKVDLSIHSFSSLWITEEENRKTKSFRKKFTIETLKEIEKLSQDFKITFNDNYITIKRYPDINRKNQTISTNTNIDIYRYRKHSYNP